MPINFFNDIQKVREKEIQIRTRYELDTQEKIQAEKQKVRNQKKQKYQEQKKIIRLTKTYHPMIWRILDEFGKAGWGRFWFRKNYSLSRKSIVDLIGCYGNAVIRIDGHIWLVEGDKSAGLLDWLCYCFSSI